MELAAPLQFIRLLAVLTALAAILAPTTSEARPQTPTRFRDDSSNSRHLSHATGDGSAPLDNASAAVSANQYAALLIGLAASTAWPPAGPAITFTGECRA